MNGDHTTIHKGYIVAHWKKNSAVGCHDDWDRACVRATGKITSIDVETRYDLEKLKDLLDCVFESGKEAKARDIRKVLEIGK